MPKPGYVTLVQSIAGIAFAAFAFSPTVASAGCKQGFCMHGQDLDHIHRVIFTHDGSAPFYNVKAGGRSFATRYRVFEFEIGSARPVTVQYQIQACRPDSCGPWVSFSHTAR
jgi:hypothetical protein